MAGISKIRLMYLGVNPHAIEWMARPPICVVAVAGLDFFSWRSFNPANVLFAAIYRLVRDHRVVAARGFHRLWYRLRWLNTGHYKRFGPWLDGLVRSGALIIDGTSTESLRQAIRQHRIDLLLVHGWDVLPMEVLQDAPYGAVNVHPSCLPQYKGALPTLWALKNGDRSSCVTIQRIGSNVDGGDILRRSKVKP